MQQNSNKGFGEKILEQFTDLFILPELQRRQQDGTLPRPVDLSAAQVIFFPDGRKPQVRINAEIKAAGKIKLKAGISKKPGESILANEVEGIDGIELSDAGEADCGHATFVRLDQHWIIAFDFRYNRGLAKKHVQAAQEFVDAAKFSANKKNWSACIDNLFSGCELLAKATLMIFPDPKFAKKATHKSIQMKFNWFADLGNVKLEYKKALNKLSGLRDKVRYLKANVPLCEGDVCDLLTTVEEMLISLKNRL